MAYSFRTRRDVLSLMTAGAVFAAAPRAFAAAPVKIATVGSGNIGGTLGTVWAKAGHPVMFSSRHPEKLGDLVKKAGPNASAGTVADAIAFADVVLLAVPYGALPQVARDHGAALAKKDLIFDSCNPFTFRDGDVATAALEKGAGQYIADLLPGAKIVRAWNSIRAVRFGEGGRAADGSRIGMPIAGDDAKALALASELIRETGFEPVVVGSLAFGKHLMPGTPLAGELSPDAIKKAAATLK